MHGRCGTLAGGILAALLVGCSATAPPYVVPATQEWTSPTGVKGTQLLTEHFDLRVTSQDRFIQEYLPSFMEAAFAEYQRLVPAAVSGDRLVVYVFATRSQWVDFTEVFAPAQAYTYLHIHAGGYTDHRTASAVAYDIGRDRTLSLLGHEGMHQYLARYLPEPVTPWLNEGLACQLEAFDMKGQWPVFTPRRNFLRRNNLREALATPDGLIPLPELLRMDAGDAIRQTGLPARTFYAQLWSLVVFLRDSQSGYAPKLTALLHDAGTERVRVAIRAYRAATPGSDKLTDGEVVFRHYITEDLDGFTNQYREFARALLGSSR